MNKNVRLQRLRHWVEILKKIPSDTESFDMYRWFKAPDSITPKEEAIRHAIKHHMTCGAAACALGWAGLDPKFRRAGLRVKAIAGEAVITTGHTHDYKSDSYAQSVLSATEFFGIQYGEAIHIVDPDRYGVNTNEDDLLRDEIRPQDVIKRIKVLIKQYS